MLLRQLTPDGLTGRNSKPSEIDLGRTSDRRHVRAGTRGTRRGGRRRCCSRTAGIDRRTWPDRLTHAQAHLDRPSPGTVVRCRFQTGLPPRPLPNRAAVEPPRRVDQRLQLLPKVWRASSRRSTRCSVRSRMPAGASVALHPSRWGAQFARRLDRRPAAATSAVSARSNQLPRGGAGRCRQPAVWGGVAPGDRALKQYRPAGPQSRRTGRSGGRRGGLVPRSAAGGDVHR